MRTILILMDSLNRHYLSSYGDSRIRTPNLDRFAAKGVVFDNHWSGSLPCMPARREIMTGRTNFLETPWGPIEAWDRCVPTMLREQSEIYSHMVTDHYHYFHRGGDGYHDLFDSWEFERGQEGDKWKPYVDAPGAPEGTRGKGVGRGAYWRNRAMIDPEDDLSYPTPRCFAGAIDFVELNKDADNWHLHLEVFDPHEPFDSPQKYRDLYGDDWDRYLYNWPAYDRLDPELDDGEAVAHIRRRYAATLTMADVWLGKLLDRIDALDMWKDTTIILTTDHGHLLGEHGYWAKNYMFDYAELAHIPMFVWAPHVKPGRRSALTTTIDLAPTILDLHDASPAHGTHGRSLLHLLGGDGEHHDWILYGYFGKDVNMTDGRVTYTRQPLPGSTTYCHTGDLRNITAGRDRPEQAEAGYFLPSAGSVPHFRIPVPSHRHRDAPEGNLVFDLVADPGQEKPIDDPAREAELAARMKELLARHDAPESQYKRLGL
ncbi:MAG: sulfatase [Spirochaetota bacterium]